MKLRFSYNWHSGYCIDPDRWRSLYWGTDKIRWCSGTLYGTSWRSTSATGTSSWSRSTRTQEREGRGCGRLSTRSPWSATCWVWRMRPSNTSAHTTRWGHLLLNEYGWWCWLKWHRCIVAHSFLHDLTLFTTRYSDILNKTYMSENINVGMSSKFHKNTVYKSWKQHLSEIFSSGFQSTKKHLFCTIQTST